MRIIPKKGKDMEGQFIALGVVLLPVFAMFIDMAFHQRLLKKLRKEAAKKASNNQ